MFALDPLTKFGDNKELVPILGSKKTAWFMAAEDWWKNSTVVILVPGECVSRKDIVLAAANKDGGTHVDKLPEKYDYLNRGFWQTGKNWHSGHQFVLLRQLAFEVLKSPELTSIVSWQES
jgi:hypothetical protein